MPECLLGVGSNLGHRQQILDSAVARLRRHVHVVASSHWRCYPAVAGPPEQQDFLNGALLIETAQTPWQLAELLHELEAAAGRQRTDRWASRTLDCDLLLFGSEQIVSESLTVPHPRMMTRRFVLEPSVEIAPELVHPSLGWTIRRLYDHLSAPPYFAVIGPDEAYCLELAQEIARNSHGTIVSLTQLGQSPSSSSGTPLEFAEAAQELLRRAMRESQFPATPVISTFCHGYGNLQIPGVGREPPPQPKLLIVTAPMESDFGRLVAGQSHMRVPTVHVSSDRDHAKQDAVGAVLAMK